MAFAETLKSLREKHNITQSDLAKQIGVTQRTISYYETGKGVPGDPKILNALANIFNVSLDELLSGNQETSKFHLLVKKLIDDTKSKKITWESFDSAIYSYVTETNWHDECLYKDMFNVKDFTQYDGYIFLYTESYFSAYQNGGYLVAKVMSPSKNIDIALFVFFDDKFFYIANKDSIKQIEELYFILSNKSSGINTFIDQYLDDSLEKTKSNESKNTIQSSNIPF